jgi:hypothetical protein
MVWSFLCCQKKTKLTRVDSFSSRVVSKNKLLLAPLIGSSECSMLLGKSKTHCVERSYNDVVTEEHLQRVFVQKSFSNISTCVLSSKKDTVYTNSSDFSPPIHQGRFHRSSYKAHLLQHYFCSSPYLWNSYKNKKKRKDASETIRDGHLFDCVSSRILQNHSLLYALVTAIDSNLKPAELISSEC